jgi:hypothetical protein
MEFQCPEGEISNCLTAAGGCSRKIFSLKKRKKSRKKIEMTRRTRKLGEKSVIL